MENARRYCRCGTKRRFKINDDDDDESHEKERFRMRIRKGCKTMRVNRWMQKFENDFVSFAHFNHRMTVIAQSEDDGYELN